MKKKRMEKNFLKEKNDTFVFEKSMYTDDFPNFLREIACTIIVNKRNGAT